MKLRRQSRSRSRSPISRRSHSDNHGDRQKGRSWLPGNDRHGHSYQDRLQGREKGHLQRDRPHYAERARLPGRKKMDKVEMERRRAEMMDNARYSEVSSIICLSVWWLGPDKNLKEQALYLRYGL